VKLIIGFNDSGDDVCIDLVNKPHIFLDAEYVVYDVQSFSPF